MASLVTAVIKRSRLEPVREALTAAGATGMTVCEVHGYGQQGGQVETYRGTEYRTEFIAKLRLDVVVADDLVDDVMDAIAGAARTGRIGDGKMWALKVDRVARIRTGEEGEIAI